MGTFLTTPETTKEAENGQATAESGLNLTYAAVAMQGWRRTQEDTHLVSTSLSNGASIFGVFDGHGGREIALFCEQQYVKTLENLESFKKGNMTKALEEVAIELDKQLETKEGQDQVVAISKGIQQEQRDKGNTEFSGGDASEEILRKIPEKVGCTACVVLVTATEIYVANVGDSRAVLSQGLSVYDLSDDHKPENEEEEQRIIKARGNVDNGRVNGELALSRAIGDMHYKRNPNLSVAE